MNIDQEYELVKLDPDIEVLKEHPKNPNRGNTEVIDESIDVNGWYGAVIAQKSTGYILAGNHRYRTAVKRGATEIPVIWKDVDDETALRIMLVDNESARQAEMDQELLGQVLDELGTLEGTGFGLSHLQAEEEAEESLKGASGGDGAGVDPGDVPDDTYTPQFGVMLVVSTEEEQEKLYEWLKYHLDEGLIREDDEEFLEDPKLRVIAV